LVKIEDLVAETNQDLVVETNQDLDRIINHHFKEVDLEGNLNLEINLNLEVAFKMHQEEHLEDSREIINFKVSKILFNKMLINWIAVIQKFLINSETQYHKYA
jgi:hypothetical protein